MLKFKDNTINLANLAPQLALVLTGTVVPIFQRFGSDVMITSANDANHSATSLHYAGCAVDIRNWYVNKDEWSELKKQIDEALTMDFDFVIESNHFHLEYQPKAK